VAAVGVPVALQVGAAPALGIRTLHPTCIGAVDTQLAVALPPTMVQVIEALTIEAPNVLTLTGPVMPLTVVHVGGAFWLLRMTTCPNGHAPTPENGPEGCAKARARSDSRIKMRVTIL
jgi:hypothetical protein